MMCPSTVPSSTGRVLEAFTLLGGTGDHATVLIKAPFSFASGFDRFRPVAGSFAQSVYT